MLGLFLSDWQGLQLPDGTTEHGYALGQCPECGKLAIHISRRTVHEKNTVIIANFYVLPEPSTDKPNAVIYRFRDSE